MPHRLLQHPLAQDTLARLRDARTPPSAFRVAAHRIALLLIADALADLPTDEQTVTTPLGPAPARVLAGDVAIVPVLRAGLGMLEAALTLVPDARVGHIGLRRDEETARCSRYYARLPEGLTRSHVLLVDPMLATGGSAVAAIDLLKAAGAQSIRMACIVAAPEGLACLDAAHPDVVVHTPAIDRELNDRKFIVPGLGDFGDRLYGTV
ncbi:MAG: uracil phosphoribosyltransferase [Acidobacteria bacterium]|nr:uracil phosphoribosyltransferase [Acidobacteriota bacterium]